MDAVEIKTHIETTVEPKMGEISTRSDRMLAEGVRALWEVALQLAKLNSKYWTMNRHELAGREEV